MDLIVMPFLSMASWVGLTAEESGEFRRIEVAASERGVSCEAGARCGRWNTQQQQEVQEQQEIESAVKAGWHRQMAEEGDKGATQVGEVNGSGSGGG